MTIEQHAEEKFGKPKDLSALMKKGGYIMGCYSQRKRDEEKVEEALYNALEIGYIDCKNIDQLISIIKKSMEEI